MDPISLPRRGSAASSVSLGLYIGLERWLKSKIDPSMGDLAVQLHRRESHFSASVTALLARLSRERDSAIMFVIYAEGSLKTSVRVFDSAPSISPFKSRRGLIFHLE